MAFVMVIKSTYHACAIPLPPPPCTLLKVFSEESSGFNTSATDQLTYNTWLAGQVRSLHKGTATCAYDLRAFFKAEKFGLLNFESCMT